MRTFVYINFFGGVIVLMMAVILSVGLTVNKRMTLPDPQQSVQTPVILPDSTLTELVDTY